MLSFTTKDNPFELVAFVTMWLSCFLFSGSLNSPLDHLYPLATMISHGAWLPLGALFLGTLYHCLSKAILAMHETRE